MTEPIYIKSIMDRIKSLQEFNIVRAVPENFEFNGTVPFDMVINEGTMSIKIYAASLDEANTKVDEYLQSI